MGNLVQNTNYKNLRGAIAPMIKTAQDVGRMLPRPQKSKKVDVSGYKGLMSQMGNYNTAQSTPATIPASISNIGKISTPYMGQTAYESQHKGIDIGAPLGKNIPSFSGGIVTGEVTGKQHLEPGSPYGNQIIITDPTTGDQWRYSHLQSAYVPIGAKVSKGDIIGSVGISGNTYSESNPASGGPHLDLRIYNLYKKTFLNPLELI